MRGRRLDVRAGAGSVVAAQLLRVALADCLGDDRFQVHLGRGRVVSADLLVQLGHAELTDPVAYGVMDDREDRRTLLLQSVDHHELPQRPGAVERLGIELGGEVEQLALGAGGGEHDFAKVRVDVELGVWHPCRRRQPSEAGDHALVEAGGLGDAGAHRLAELRDIELAIEEDQ